MDTASYLNLSYVLSRLGRHAEALEIIEQGLTHYPQEPLFHLNRGHALRSLGEYKQAIEAFRRPELKGELKMLSQFALAETLTTLLQTKEATLIYENILLHHPGCHDMRYALGKLRLLLGRLSSGFAACESRLQIPANFLPPVPSPRWKGEPIEGKRLLVRCEQGLGDTIQLMRYIPLLSLYRCQVILEVQPTLSELFKHLGFTIVEATRDEIPPHDCHVYFFSLPHLFKTTLSSIPPPISIASVRTPVQNRIGLAWKGSPTHSKDFERSIRIELLEPLLKIPGLDPVCLQPDLSEEEERFLDAHSVKRPRLGNWSDTIRELEQCEKVICVDTCIAHLAASMGIPTWILISFSPDWRWLLHRSNSPWYPGVKLFRQRKMLEWQEPIETVRQELLNDMNRPNL